MFEKMSIEEAASECHRRLRPLLAQSDFASAETVYVEYHMEAQWQNPKDMPGARQALNAALREALRVPRVNTRHGIFDHITQSRFTKAEG